MKKKPFLALTFSDRIWKIGCYPPWLLIELRNLSSSLASYTAIDLEEKKILWQDRSFFSSSYSFLCDVKGNKAIFSSFTEGNLPKTQGITVIDIPTSTINWQDESLCYINGYETHLLAYSVYDVQRNVLAYKLDTGKVTDEKKQSSARSEPLCIYPSRYFEEDDSYKLIEKFLKVYYQINAKHFIDYLENETIVALFFQEENDEKQGWWWLLDKKIGEHLYKVRSKQPSFMAVNHYILLLPEPTKLLLFDTSVNYS